MREHHAKTSSSLDAPTRSEKFRTLAAEFRFLAEALHVESKAEAALLRQTLEDGDPSPSTVAHYRRCTARTAHYFRTTNRLCRDLGVGPADIHFDEGELPSEK